MKEELVVTDKYFYTKNRGGSKTLNETDKRGEDEVKIVVLYYKEAEDEVKIVVLYYKEAAA